MQHKQPRVPKNISYASDKRRVVCQKRQSSVVACCSCRIQHIFAHRGRLKPRTRNPLSPAGSRERNDAPGPRRHAEVGRLHGGMGIPAPVVSLVLLWMSGGGMGGRRERARWFGFPEHFRPSNTLIPLTSSGTFSLSYTGNDIRYFTKSLGLGELQTVHAGCPSPSFCSSLRLDTRTNCAARGW